MKTNTFTKILMLNIAQDMAWVSFAMYMYMYFDVPLYIVMLPVLANIGMFLYGARMVMKDNTLNPRDTPVFYKDNNSVEEVDEMLATIANENLGDSLYGNVPRISPHLVYNREE